MTTSKSIIIGTIAALSVVPVIILLANPADKFTSTELAQARKQVVLAPTIAKETVETSETIEPVKESELVNSNKLGSASLIDSFEIVAPNNSSLCGSREPWLEGEQIVSFDTRLTAVDCFALRMTTFEDVMVHVYSHSEDGTLVRILPNSCNALGPINAEILAGEELQIPQDANGLPLALGLDDASGREWFYTVAVTNEETQSLLNGILKEVPDVCQKGPIKKRDIADLQSSMEDLQTASNGNLHWIKRSFLHN